MSDTNDTFYNELMDIIHKAQSMGYVIVVWTPDEIGDADSDHLENIMIERGADYIDARKFQKVHSDWD